MKTKIIFAVLIIALLASLSANAYLLVPEKHVGKADHHKSLRIKYDFNKFEYVVTGVMQKDNMYLFYMIHGADDGSTALETIYGKYIDITDMTIRDAVYENYGVMLSDDDIVIIAPCYPQKVREAREGEDIIILGEWNTPSWSWDMETQTVVFTI